MGGGKAGRINSRDTYLPERKRKKKKGGKRRARGQGDRNTSVGTALHNPQAAIKEKEEKKKERGND